MLRAADEAEGSEAASVVRLTPASWIVEAAVVRDGDGRRLPGTALGVVDGRITAIGSTAAVRRRLPATAAWLRFHEATVLPGLVDPHVHVAGMAARECELDCASAPDVDALLGAVARRHRRTPPGEWIRGAGLDESRLGRLPTAAELERAAPGRPVRLRHRSRHASVLSAAALVRLGTAVPAGGVGAEGLVAGREPLLGRLVGPLPAPALVAGLRAVSGALVRRGVTCVGDASPRPPRAARALAAMLDAAGFAPRVVGMGRAEAAPWSCGERLGFGGVKILVEDDAAGMRPHPSVLARRVRAAASRGLRVAIHCVTLGTLVAALEAFRGVPARHRRGRGHRLEHLGECPPALVPEIARLGLAVVGNPAFVHWRGDIYLGERSVAPGWLHRSASLVRAGVTVAAASDAPVAPCDPWGSIAAARERRTRGGRTLGARERVGAARALDFVCRTAAAVTGCPDLGRLARGGVADLVVVDRDPVAASAGGVRDTTVLLTMIGGEVVWRA